MEFIIVEICSTVATSIYVNAYVSLYTRVEN